MGKEILVDTDIILKAFRGDKIKISNLKQIRGRYCISVITYIEVMRGARTIRKMAETRNALKDIEVFHLTEEVSKAVLKIFSKYSHLGKPMVADSLIGCTAIVNKMEIYTDNKSDFELLDGIEFYKENE